MNDLEQHLRDCAPAGDPGAAAAAAAVAARAAREGQADLAYTVVSSPVGELTSVCSRRGLVCLHFGTERLDALLDRVAGAISPRIVESSARFDEVRRQLDEYFAGERDRFELPLDWSLSGGFGRRVLRATAAIPYGRSATYNQVAQRAGSPRAVRAAGNALAANPIPIVVPCHRVLRTGGALGGYGGGIERKRWLLEHEGLRLS